MIHINKNHWDKNYNIINLLAIYFKKNNIRCLEKFVYISIQMFLIIFIIISNLNAKKIKNLRVYQVWTNC